MFSVNLKNKKGFTLVELMVAVAVFSLVMVTAMSALVNVIDANKKARSIKTAINNISMTLEGLSKDMRMGSDYKCLDEGGGIVECALTGNSGIRFKSSKATDLYVYYKLSENATGSGKINYCTSSSVNGLCASWSPLTSSEVDIDNLKFYILGIESPDNIKTQPKMIMTISGKAGSGKTETEFDLQTGVSQRVRPDQL